MVELKRLPHAPSPEVWETEASGKGPDMFTEASGRVGPGKGPWMLTFPHLHPRAGQGLAAHRHPVTRSAQAAPPTGRIDLSLPASGCGVSSIIG